MLNEKKINEPPSFPRDPEYEVLQRGLPTEKKDDTIAQLENRLTVIENRLYEERFILIIVCVVFIDAFMFMPMSNWTGPLVIGVIELMGFYILADRYKINVVAPLIDRITGFVRRAAKTDSQSEDKAKEKDRLT